MSTQRDLPTGPATKLPVSAGVQIGVSVLIGVIAAVAVASFTELGLIPLLSWDFASFVYLAWVWGEVWRLDAEHTAHLAVRVDPTRAVADALLLAASVVSLGAVGLILGDAADSHGTRQIVLAALAVASIALSWGVVHTVYTLRYARLYYSGTDGGVDFKSDQPPEYADFAYLSFTIGMTFQVSDTDLQEGVFRRTALTHALLSFVFVTGIVATTINLVASLGT